MPYPICRCFLMLLLAGSLRAQPVGHAGALSPVHLHTQDANPFGFFEYLPLGFEKSSPKTWPLMLFFHGLGEKGNGNSDLANILKVGVTKRLNRNSNSNPEDDFHPPLIVIAPQSSSGWFSPDLVKGFLDWILARYPVNEERIYVTGLSAGGGATWGFANKYPDIPAAIAPICGAGNVSDPAPRLLEMPLWIFHNFDDGTVKLGSSINNANRIAEGNSSVMHDYPYSDGNTKKKAADGDYTLQYSRKGKAWSIDSGVRPPADRMAFTIYATGGHNAWDKVYADAAFWEWILSQKRGHTISTNRFSLPGTSAKGGFLRAGNAFDLLGRTRKP